MTAAAGAGLQCAGWPAPTTWSCSGSGMQHPALQPLHNIRTILVGANWMETDLAAGSIPGINYLAKLLQIKYWFWWHQPSTIFNVATNRSPHPQWCARIITNHAYFIFRICLVLFALLIIIWTKQPDDCGEERKKMSENQRCLMCCVWLWLTTNNINVN